jgi:hypothetical protein
MEQKGDSFLTDLFGMIPSAKPVTDKINQVATSDPVVESLLGMIIKYSPAVRYNLHTNAPRHLRKSKIYIKNKWNQEIKI